MLRSRTDAHIFQRNEPQFASPLLEEAQAWPPAATGYANLGFVEKTRMEEHGRGKPTGSDDEFEFIDAMQEVCCGHGSVTELLLARASENITDDARKVIDCAILYICYIKYNRPSYIKKCISQIWKSLP